MEQQGNSSPPLHQPPLFLPSEFCLMSGRVVTWPLKQTSAARAEQEARLWWRVSLTVLQQLVSAVNRLLKHPYWLSGVATRPASVQTNVILANPNVSRFKTVPLTTACCVSPVQTSGAVHVLPQTTGRLPAEDPRLLRAQIPGQDVRRGEHPGGAERAAKGGSSTPPLRSQEKSGIAGMSAASKC